MKLVYKLKKKQSNYRLKTTIEKIVLEIKNNDSENTYCNKNYLAMP